MTTQDIIKDSQAVNEIRQALFDFLFYTYNMVKEAGTDECKSRIYLFIAELSDADKELIDLQMRNLSRYLEQTKEKE